MVHTPASPKNPTLSIELPSSIGLHVTQEQFAALATVNRDLKLERTAQGELIVNPPTGWETGAYNWRISGEYIDNGTLLGWLIDLQQRQVEIS